MTITPKNYAFLAPVIAQISRFRRVLTSYLNRNMQHSTTFKAVFASLAMICSLQLASAQTITTNMMAPPGFVNMNVPGMKMYIVQGNSGLPMDQVHRAEALISGKAIDPTTGQPFAAANAATPDPADGDFIYNIDRYINLHEQGVNGSGANAADNFSMYDAPPMDIPDDPEPGTPGGGDYFAVEFTGFLQLPAGTVRFGVNSDDGFRLTIGSGVNRIPSAVQLISLDTTRGFGNTEANITVTQAGLYPFRLLWWENTGANSGIEFYTFAPGTTSGNRYLVNDTNQANSIKAFRETTASPPLITFATPSSTTWIDPSGTGSVVPPAPLMRVEITDGATTLANNSITFSLDGTNLTGTVTKSGAVTSISVLAPLLSAAVHTNRLAYADSAGNSYTSFWTFTVPAYSTIPPAYALASVDPTKPGFKAKIHQIGAARNPSTGLAPNAERQIADGYIDPTTGQPYANMISPQWTHADGTTVDPIGNDGLFVMPGVINLDDQAGVGTAGGNFSVNSVPPVPDDTVPGIPGNSAFPSDYYVASFETILDLKAGAYRFGVNSDDGFRLSAGRGPGDVVGVQLGTAGDRGMADTYADFVVGADGLYPFRLMYWESAGANAGVEFFVVDLATGTKTLINDLTGFTPIKAYRESATSRPYISRVLPTVNYGYAFADDDVVIDIKDGAIPLNADSAALTINGVTQTITAGKTNNVTTIRRAGSLSKLLFSGANTNTLIYSFTEGGNTVTATNTWIFTVPRYIRPIPPANKVLATDVSGSGFHVRARQIDRSEDANQGNGGRHTGNNMPGPEIELADGYINPNNNQPYSNLLDPTLANSDGSYDLTNTSSSSAVLNFNHSTTTGQAANGGIFNGDVNVPGMPGTGTSNLGLDNTVHEFTTYLNLKAGDYLFGLNVDDGWTCISAPNPRDTLGTLLGFRDAPGGQNGNPANNPNAAFNVIVPEDGIYPFRILFWEGGGGVNTEFFNIDRNTGTQVLVNDTTGAFPSVVNNGGNLISPITSYNAYTGQTRPWVKFSVYPMPYIGTIQPQTTTGGNVSLWQNRNQQSGPGPIQVKLGLLNGSWNSGEVANSSTAQRPFGDAVGAVVADLLTSSVGMVLDGVSVTPTVTDVPNSTDKLVLYTPPTPLSSTSNHVAGLVYANTTNYWIFSVITNVSVATGVALPSSQADPNAAGFHVKVVQSTTARPGTGNSATNAEAQLAGSIPSVAIPGPNPDGSYTITNIINWSSRRVPGQTGAEIGNFQTILTGTPDDPIPGLPGTGLTGAAGIQNVAAEIFAYLDLPAGYQKFGVNGDDGWAVKIGTPGVTNGTILFTIDRGAGAQDIPFAFITPEAGLYPIRLVWYQGTGDGNLEFFTYGPNNTKIPVNDRTNPNAVKAYYKVISAAQIQITNVSIAGGMVTVTWTGGGTLYSTTSLNPGTTWTTTGASNGSYTTAVGTGNVFFRAQQ